MPTQKGKERPSHENGNEETKKKQSSGTIEWPAHLSRIKFMACLTKGESYVLFLDKGFPEEGNAHQREIKQGNRRVSNK